MNKYTIIVLDYESGSVRMFHFNNEPEDPEQWLSTHDSRWKESQCYWMGVKTYDPQVEEHWDADSIEPYEED